MLIQSAWPPGVPAFGALCPFSTLSSTISCGTFFVFAAVTHVRTWFAVGGEGVRPCYSDWRVGPFISAPVC